MSTEVIPPIGDTMVQYDDRLFDKYDLAIFEETAQPTPLQPSEYGSRSNHTIRSKEVAAFEESVDQMFDAIMIPVPESNPMKLDPTIAQLCDEVYGTPVSPSYAPTKKPLTQEEKLIISHNTFVREMGFIQDIEKILSGNKEVLKKYLGDTQ